MDGKKNTNTGGPPPPTHMYTLTKEIMQQKVPFAKRNDKDWRKREIEGAQKKAKNEKIFDCIIRGKYHSSPQLFMIFFVFKIAQIPTLLNKKSYIDIQKKKRDELHI